MDWSRALVVVSRTNSFTQAHALFLEWLGIGNAKTAGRYALVNKNAGERPHIPESLEADCKDLHDNARILLTTLGYPVFEKAGKYQTKEKDKELYCRRKGGVGRGLYTPEGLVVLKGSTGPREDAPSIRGTPLARRREQLITDGVFRVEGGLVVVTEDYVFSTPSAAAEVLLGRKANGWTVWKDAAGRTLDEIWRAGVKGTV